MSLRAITKRFGRVLACDAVDLDLVGGHIHGLLGENGAGKSTLMKILIGLVTADSGTVRVHGEARGITSPMQAGRLGIAMVHQHLSLVDALTVWENVALGDAGRLDRSETHRRIADISERYGLEVEPDARVGDLPVGLRQRVEIIKCLRRDPSVLIFDEPTSVLSPAESTRLFASLRRVVADEGRAVALVSHKLDEVLSVTDQITVMRDGRVVERLETASADPEALTRAMFGRALAADGSRDRVPAVASPRSELALRIEGAVAGPRRGVVGLAGFSVDVAPGEIVGIVGLEGSGQRNLADLLSSLIRLDSGSVSVAGAVVPTGRAGAMAAARVGVIPEDRHDSGLVLDMSVGENLALVHPEQFSRRGIIDGAALRARAAELIAEFGIQCEGPDAPMWTLSGGNQQRVVLARELSALPRVLVAAHPTRGLDVGAVEQVMARLRSAAADGVGVLLITSEVEDLVGTADRVVVMRSGAVVAELAGTEIGGDRLASLLSGASP